MSRWTRCLSVVALYTVPACLWLYGDDRTPVESPPSQAADSEEHDRWMRIKLQSSQQILAGLTSGDLRDVERNTRRIQVFNLLEQWLRDNPLTRSSEYRGQLNAFDYAAKELVRKAGDGDTGGALEAYLNLTRSCVGCHQVMRDAAPTK